LVASVDRSRVNSGETVELTVESSDVTQFGKPDLSPLDAQFEVSGTRQINPLTTLGGDNHATTRWIITLLPKENGTVVIPPLQVGELKTQPISLQVVETASQNTSA
ncbi:BatD family protein, partial [Pseudoalteromonas sp. CR1]|uniref:BatD family protein n=1 Tax=Pseudoalteromonas sp. CR1 TaxID=2861964 RepID=UPI001C5F4E88